MNKRVLILSASAGSGHVRAAEALATSFRGQPGVEAVEHLDALDYTNKLFHDFYSKLYLKLVTAAPEVLGWAYKASDEPWKTDAMRLRLDRLQARKLVRFIRRFQPDIVICTHFMPTGIIAHLIEKEVIQTHLSVVLTDMDMHAMWLSRTFHRYFVALEETKAHLLALGLPEERITVSGIPVDPVFAESVDRFAVRESLGLARDRFTLLFSAGAYGVSPAEFVVTRLQQLRHPVQTIVICGKNDDLRARVENLVGTDNPDFRVLGYTEQMHDLMKASDLFLGKPGGLTTAEALACGLPMAILSPIPGQEERNSDHLLEEGAAIKCNELTTIAYKIDALLDNPARLDSMRQRARELGRPHAAATVVRTLLEDDLPPLRIDAVERGKIAEAAAGERS
ncbi:MAG: glycosyltransferase [Verrucomicrobia bacterium]|nr:glycosyltransferase [Verrucomicrobiota bacterium]